MQSSFTYSSGAVAIPGHWLRAVVSITPVSLSPGQASLNHDKLAWGYEACTDSPEITLHASSFTPAAVRLEIRGAFRRMLLLKGTGLR